MKNSKHKRLALKSAGILLGIGSIGLGANTIYAACTIAPDCAALGYTQTSCPDGGVKCPWDTSKMFCKKGEAACDNSYTTSMCTNSCSSPSGTPCLKNGTAYYPGCTTSRCGSSQTCSYGSCVCKAEFIQRCNGQFEKATNGECNGLYAACSCSNGAIWSKEEGCVLKRPYTFNCCDTNCSRNSGSNCTAESCNIGINNCYAKGGVPGNGGCNIQTGLTTYNCKPRY